MYVYMYIDNFSFVVEWFAECCCRHVDECSGCICNNQSRNNLTNKKGNNSEKMNLFYLKFKIFILIIYKINKYLKSVFTVNKFQDFVSSVNFL